MTRKLFGTDGVRGVAGELLTAELALGLAQAATRLARSERGVQRPQVLIIRDTRESGEMLQAAVAAGVAAAGGDALLGGVLPTPAAPLLIADYGFDLAAVLSASHNPFQDNGIKFFGPDGQKLSDDHEMQIEALMENGLEDGLAKPRKIGRAKRIDDAQARYIEFAKRTFPKQLTLDGLRVVIDCANGAAYKVAPAILWELGAEVIAIGDEPNGLNINNECGSTSPEAMQRKVRERRADFGIALDGDADRVVMSDEEGNLIDGDQILALIAGSWSKTGKLKGSGVVGTVMSNAGLERYLKTLDLKLGRAAVGDRYVVEMMNQGHYNVGGEQSGHIILNDFGTTGDGIVAALQVLAVLAEDNKPASEAAHVFDPLPQVLENVRFKNGSPLSDARVTDCIKAGEARLNGAGRILVRKSGTEPVIRVMAEGEDETVVREVVHDIVVSIQEATT